MDIAEFLTARLDEDERIARAAGEGAAPALTGEHWQWEHLGDRDPNYPEGHALTDQPVDLDRWGELIGVNGPDYASEISLRSVETYLSSVGELPHFVVHHTDEQEVATARHIARYDPARVLADVAAKRAVLAWAVAHPRTCETEHPQFDVWHPDGLHGPNEVAVMLAQPYADHPNFNPAWAPSSEVTTPR